MSDHESTPTPTPLQEGHARSVEQAVLKRYPQAYRILSEVETMIKHAKESLDACASILTEPKYVDRRGVICIGENSRAG
jgi:hypothetical protein